RFPHLAAALKRLIESDSEPAGDAAPSWAGPFAIRERIGAGGMGVVYRVHDSQFGRALAVKVMQPGMPTQRFVAEAEGTGRLQHPGVPPVYARGELPDGRPFFAMKLVEGQNLEDLLGDHCPPSAELQRFVGIFEQVCQTVGYAHSQKLIHRDLKPTNVM